MSSNGLLKEPSDLFGEADIGKVKSRHASQSNDTAIWVHGLSKCYHLYDRPQDRLKQIVIPRLKRLVGMEPFSYAREFWALRDVSFEVRKGEAVGIIGRNGAGKSTLLQLISGTLSPTTGSVWVAGTVAALLELGSGFNPEFTGRENVHLNASVLGLLREQIDQKFDDIAAFADIGEFLDQPTKTYSSGMLMRLAFAVNTCIDPDILIVDEALGVGDVPFQFKCYKRLRRLIDDGTTVLFVSHDIATVRALCRRALWLKEGRLEMWGDAKHVAKEYERFCWQEQGIVLHRAGMSESPESASVSMDKGSCGKGRTAEVSFPPQILEANPTFQANRLRSRIGTGDVVIQNFMVLNEAGVQVTACDYNDKLTLCYLVELHGKVSSDFILGVRFRDLKGNYVYSANDISSLNRIDGVAGDRYFISTNLAIPLTHQDYALLTGIFGFKDGIAFGAHAYDYSKSVIWDVIEEAAFLTVRPCRIMPLPGPVNASIHINVVKLNA